MNPAEKRKFLEKLRAQGVKINQPDPEEDEDFKEALDDLQRELDFYTGADIEKEEAEERQRIRALERKLAAQDELMEKIKAEREEHQGKKRRPYGVYGA